MKRLFVVLAALAALALIGTAVATAAVSVTDGVGHVDKGDVQKALGWNNADFEKGVGSLKFTAGTQVMGNQTRWQCSGGGEQSQTSLVTQNRTPKVTTLYSANGKQITGWDLTGFSFAYVSGGYSSAPYVGYCPAGG